MLVKVIQPAVDDRLRDGLTAWATHLARLFFDDGKKTTALRYFLATVVAAVFRGLRWGE